MKEYDNSIAVLTCRRQGNRQMGVIPTFTFLCTSWSTPTGDGARCVVFVLDMLICSVEERRIRLPKDQQMLNEHLTSLHMQIQKQSLQLKDRRKMTNVAAAPHAAVSSVTTRLLRSRVTSRCRDRIRSGKSGPSSGLYVHWYVALRQSTNQRSRCKNSDHLFMNHVTGN